MAGTAPERKRGFACLCGVVILVLAKGIGRAVQRYRWSVVRNCVSRAAVVFVSLLLAIIGSGVYVIR